MTLTLSYPVPPHLTQALTVKLACDDDKQADPVEQVGDDGGLEPTPVARKKIATATSSSEQGRRSLSL
jgi:hypothetical protein